jgi:hypothetical protein
LPAFRERERNRAYWGAKRGEKGRGWLPASLACRLAATRITAQILARNAQGPLTWVSGPVRAGEFDLRSSGEPNDPEIELFSVFGIQIGCRNTGTWNGIRLAGFRVEAALFGSPNGPDQAFSLFSG